MRYKQLVEYIDVQKTMQQLGTRLEIQLRADTSAEIKIPSDVIKFVSNEIDPTPNQKYSLWILRTYIKGGIQRFEDMSRVNHYLTIFDKHKQKLPIKDINQIRSLSDLGQMVLPLEQEKTSREEKKGLEQELINNKEVEFLWNDNELKIVSPKTEQASCYYGRNTQWCTAATVGQNYFDEYNKQGPLYIVIDKPNNKRFQLQFESEQYMDENDTPINLYELVKKYQLDKKAFNKNFSFEKNTLTIKTDIYIKYINEQDKLHRTNGPALTWWYENGQKKSEEWWINNKLHRTDGPAYTSWHENGQKQLEAWFGDGKYHRTDGPAYNRWYENGQKEAEEWYINGNTHRTNGPATIWWHENGQKRKELWSINGKLHKTNGPAITWWLKNGQKEAEQWFIDGQRHRAKDDQASSR